MPVRTTIPYPAGTFFITFTCYKWLPLINAVDGYDLIYKWFDFLTAQNHKINAFVIMPNHLHAIITFVETHQSINTIIGNGKRFIAYEIVNRLKEAYNFQILTQLLSDVEKIRQLRNKKHNVWEISFDWKECRSESFILEKLNYIHLNPCRGKWNLCDFPADYLHSSAKYYSLGEQGRYAVVNVFS